MARHRVQQNTSEKWIEDYMDFSGGQNSEMANEKLKNNEFVVMQNVDIQSRASVKRRHGRVKIGSITGNGQGLFFYYRQFQQEPDMIVAVSGKLYVKEFGSSIFTEIPITYLGNPWTFQTTLPIEARQWRDSLFVATGDKLVELTYDSSWQAKIVEPYKPTVQEVIVLGTNALASDPATWIQGKEASTVSIEGITSSVIQGQLNSPIRFTAHVVKPVNVNVKYSFSWRKTGSGSYTYVAQSINDNYTDITFNEIGGYDIKAETKRFDYIIDKFDESEDYTNAIKGGEYDSYSGEGSLILQGSTPNPDDSSLKAWKDLPTPLDLTKGNTIEWSFTVYSSSTSSGLKAGDVKMHFYTEGNLTTPVLTVSNTGGAGRGIYIMNQIDSDPSWEGSVPASIAWRKETSSYDGSITGLDKIVRVGFSGDCVSTGNYVPADGSYGWNVWYEDTTSRFDEIIYYQSGTEISHIKSDYQVAGVADPETDPETYKELRTCRSIRVHADRLLIFNDSKFPSQMYVSDANNPRYFPTNKRIDYSLDRKEPLTAVIRFKDYHVVFTKTTITMLTGDHPQEYIGDDVGIFKKKVIHDQIGCIAGRTVQVVNNRILFLSADGLYALTPNPNISEDMMVRRMDYPVKSEITPDENACALVHDSQYWLCLPSKKEIFRLYYETGAWVKDKSSKLNIIQFERYMNDIYNLTSDGTIYKHDLTVYNDDGDVYDMIIETKAFDLSASIHYKKLRKLYVIGKHYETHHVQYYVTVYPDSAIGLTPETGWAEVDESTGTVVWKTKSEPNFNFYTGTTFGRWLMGLSPLGKVDFSIQESAVEGSKCRRVKIEYRHSDDAACELFGFAIEFRMNKI